jgi:integrase
MARRPYGSGSLYTRAGVWYGHWRADGGRQVKRRVGEVRREGSRDGLTRTQAEAELRKLIGTVAAGPVVKGDALTIAELSSRYLADPEGPARKRATVEAVESVLRTWFAPYFAERDLRKISEQDVRELMGMMRDGRRPGARLKGDRHYGRKLSAKSIRNYIGTLSALLSYAERRRWLEANVAGRVRLPAKPEHTEIRFLDPVEVRALVRAAPQVIDRVLYLAAAMAGLREGELVALRWRDVDWTAARIRVRQNYVLGEFGTPKSRRSTRSVPMADDLAGELDRLFKASSWTGADDLVFAGAHGGPLEKSTILRRFRRALAAAGLDDSHDFHDLRHTFGTAMAAAGVPMRTLQEWMGHRDIATTQIYADYAPSAHEAAFVEAAFGRESLPAQLGSNLGSNLSESTET